MLRWIGGLANAAIEANEEAHGSRLHTELMDSMSRINQLEQSLAQTLLEDFVARKTEIKRVKGNWSRDGRLKAAGELRAEGKKRFDFNMAEGYALWMTSVWLESGERSSGKARMVFEHLDAIGIPSSPKSRPDTTANPPVPKSRPDTTAIPSAPKARLMSPEQAKKSDALASPLGKEMQIMIAHVQKSWRERRIGLADFNADTIANIILAKPETLGDLRRVPGVTEEIVRIFGQQTVSLMSHHMNQFT